MTGEELIKQLQALGKENLKREVIMFDGPASYTPYRVKVLDEDLGKYAKGKILID